MGWFSRKKSPSPPSDDLQDAFLALQKDFRALQMEWDITYDKIRVMMGRVSKRAAIMEADTANNQEEEPPVPSSAAPPNGPAWTPAMHKAQAQILARRARGIPSA